MMLRNFSFVNEIKKHTMNFDYTYIIYVYFWTLFFHAYIKTQFRFLSFPFGKEFDLFYFSRISNREKKLVYY